ncbi:MAG: MFS transporter, partial [Spirochaetota bacterium]
MEKQNNTTDNNKIPLPAFSRSEWGLCLLLALCMFTVLVDGISMMPLSPLVQADLGINAQMFGHLITAFALPAGISGFIFAYMVFKFPRRILFLLAFGGFFVGTLLCALAESFLALIIARVIAGFFGGVLGGLCNATVGDVFPAQKRGRAMSIVSMGFASASAFGVPLGLILSNIQDWNLAFLNHYTGWPMPFLFLSAMIAVLWFALFLVFPRNISRVTAPQHFGKVILPLIFSRRTGNLNLLTLSLYISTFVLVPFYPSYLVFNVGFPQEQIYLLYLGGGLTCLFAMPLLGQLGDRLGKRRIFIGLSFLWFGITILFTHYQGQDILTWLFLFIGFMLFGAGRTPLAMAVITDNIQLQERASYMSVNASIVQISIAIGSSIGGILAGSAEGEAQPLLHFSYN